jgi:aspartate/methionine/tyrosine aminotransferase
MSDYTFAARMQGLGVPSSLAVLSRVQELRQQGLEIINFGTRGDTPKRAKEAAIAMMQSDAAASYTHVRGLPALRQAIAKKLRADNAIQADPETDIIVSLGGMEGVFSTLLALVDRGDEVLVCEPGWLGFGPMIRIAGATPVPVPVAEDDGFRFNIDALRKAVTSQTKLLILCNPDNPTGRVLDRSELEAIASVAREFDFLVLMDEAYENFVYDGRKHVSMAALDGMGRRTITIQTVSKIHNMFGWRVGWVVADKEIIEPILAVHSHAVTCPASFAQAGAVAVLEDSVGEGDRPFTQIVDNYEKQRNAMVEALRNIPGVKCDMPDGAYFTFPNFKHFAMPSTELCTYLLETGQVATTSGSAFGAAGEGHLRLVFNAAVEEIERGVARIGDALSKIGVAKS